MNVLIECKCARAISNARTRAFMCLLRINTKNADRALLIFNSRVKIGHIAEHYMYMRVSSTLFVQLSCVRNNIMRDMRCD